MNVGTACGSKVGACVPGLLQCNAGTITCVGATGPTQEICDGIDNDCDGTIDNGIQAGAPCTPDYDQNLYPGVRDKGACKPGILQCNGNGGTICVGGVGPSPEVCDGIDNDCDGQIDEVGMPPDGIDGTSDPTGTATGNIGDTCGNNQGACTQGTYACVNGMFACLGGMQGQPEQCDCKDNDCDGVIDNPNPNGQPLCSTGKSCVKGAAGCQCAAPCGGEIPCPPGQKCEHVTNPSDGTALGDFCTQDYCMGDCTTKTVTDTSGNTVCAPAGSLPNADCVTPPVCACKGQSGCQNPCNGITCPTGSACTDYGPNAGTCVVDNCYNVPCVGCDKACNLGGCVPNPCGVANACPTGKECKPSADFMSAVCVDSCADVSCSSGKACKDGKCVATCSPACASGEVCDTTQATPTCVMNACLMMSPDAGTTGPIQCSDGSYCDPLTGQCGQNPPCDGVICPTGQVCDTSTSECETPTVITTSSSTGASMSNTGAGAGSTTGTGSTGTGNGSGGAPNQGVFGLPTGGGGCSVEPGSSDPVNDLPLALAALAVVVGVRRKRKSSRGGEEVAS
jgi:MYXO-CTERM domain-containing protein